VPLLLLPPLHPPRFTLFGISEVTIVCGRCLPCSSHRCGPTFFLCSALRVYLFPSFLPIFYCICVFILHCASLPMLPPRGNQVWDSLCSFSRLPRLPTMRRAPSSAFRRASYLSLDMLAPTLSLFFLTPFRHYSLQVPTVGKGVPLLPFLFRIALAT